VYFIAVMIGLKSFSLVLCICEHVAKEALYMQNSVQLFAYYSFHPPKKAMKAVLDCYCSIKLNIE
jgi:hypothetical protein